MVATRKIGVALHEFGAINQIEAIVLAEQLGVSTAWLTTGGLAPDAMGIFTAAAARTSQIGLGTAIVPMFPRHPLVLVQQTLVVAALAPGRFRLGVGPSHQPAVENMYGIPFERPLEYLREYVTILRSTLHHGKVAFDGKRLHAHGELTAPSPPVPVLVSALRPASYRLAGEISDGALAWVCPLPYLRDEALPALRAGAAKANREVPPLIAHCFAAVHEDAAAVRETARNRLAVYARLPFYQEMFVRAGYPEARQGVMSDAMLDAVVVHGDEQTVAGRLQQYLSEGMDEVIVSALVVGDDRRVSLERTLRLIGTL